MDYLNELLETLNSLKEEIEKAKEVVAELEEDYKAIEAEIIDTMKEEKIDRIASDNKEYSYSEMKTAKIIPETKEDFLEACLSNDLDIVKMDVNASSLSKYVRENGVPEWMEGLVEITTKTKVRSKEIKEEPSEE